MKKTTIKLMLSIVLALGMVMPAGPSVYAEDEIPPVEIEQSVEVVDSVEPVSTEQQEPEQPVEVSDPVEPVSTEQQEPEQPVEVSGPVEPVSTEQQETEQSEENETPQASVQEIVETIAETGAIVVDSVGEPISLTSLEVEETLLVSDPWFDAGAGVIVGYSATDSCAAGVTECHTNQVNAIQSALDDARSTGTVITIEAGDYSALDVSINKVVTFKTMVDVLVNSINLFTGESVSLDAGSMKFSALNVFVNAGASIQDGVDLVNSGGVVTVRDGTYAGQVVVDNKDLTIEGEGDVTIEAVANMPLGFAGNNHHPIIMVKNSNNVNLSNLTVDGKGLGVSGNNYRLYGIEYYNAGGSIKDSTVTGIRDNPFSGNQHGVGIQFYNADGVYREALVDNVTVKDFNKNGINMSGSNLYGIVRNSTVIGQGTQGLNAQNGIQYWDAFGVIENNTISGFQFRNPDNYWNEAGTGILVYYPGGPMSISGNTVTDTDTALYMYESPSQGGPQVNAEQSWNAEILNNTFADNLWGLLIYNFSNVFASGNSFLNNEYYGVDSYQDRPFTNSNIVINNNDIIGNGYGIAAEVGYDFSGSDSGTSMREIVDARNNFWGDPTGPSALPETLYLNNNGLGTPSGAGDYVTDFVDFGEFLSKSIFSSNPPSDPGDPSDDGDTPLFPGIPPVQPVGGGFVIPVTGGQMVGLNCGVLSVLTLPNGDSTILDNIDCTMLASLMAGEPAELPVLPEGGAKVVSSLTFGLVKEGSTITTIPGGGKVTVSFRVPEGFENSTFEILAWDASLNDGLGGWLKLIATVVDMNGTPTVQALVPDGFTLPVTFVLTTN